MLPFVRITSKNWGGGADGNNFYAAANAAACKAVTAIVFRHTENRHLAHNVRLIPHLVNILLNGDVEEKKSVVVSFSELLKHNTDNRDVMVSVGGVEALTVICRLGDNFLKSTAALQIKMVCANSDVLTTELTKVGGVPPLISMLNSHNTLLQRHAAQAAAGLVLNKDFLNEIIVGGGIASLVTLLVNEDDETATYSCIGLGRCVAQNLEARRIAKEMGGEEGRKTKRCEYLHRSNVTFLSLSLSRHSPAGALPDGCGVQRDRQGPRGRAVHGRGETRRGVKGL